MGNPAADGDMGTVLTEVFGQTVKGTATLESTEPTTEDIGTEEVSTLLDTLTTADAVWTLKASTYNVSADTMVKLFGGTVSGTAPNLTWTAPVGGGTLDVYQSVSVTTKSGIVINLVKVKLLGSAALAFDKTKLGQINWTGKVLTPDKAVGPMSIVFGTAG